MQFILLRNNIFNRKSVFEVGRVFEFDMTPYGATAQRRIFLLFGRLWRRGAGRQQVDGYGVLLHFLVLRIRAEYIGEKEKSFDILRSISLYTDSAFESLRA